MSKTITSFADAVDGVSKIGGKGLSLVKMTKAGFSVPPGFIISSEVQKSDQAFEQSVGAAFDELGAKYVAVRSSAVAEDGSNAAWAGQLETILNVTKDTLLEAIEKCWASVNSDRAQAYAAQQKLQAGKVAVVVQEMIQSEVSGVGFSAHPVTGSTYQLVIEAGLGLGEAIVSGTITPDTYILQKQPLKILGRHISEQTKKLTLHNDKTEYQLTMGQGTQQKLTDECISELAQTIIKLEEYYGFPVDIEWALANDKIYITQCRPITTL